MSEESQLPPQVQEQLARYQQLQQTLQVVSTQKQQLEIELSETDKALTELEKAGNEVPVYKSVGSILVKVDRSGLIAELKEKKELLNTRVTTLGNQEQKTLARVKEAEEKLRERLGATGPRAA
ncbi:MAG: prefoldin subunit beta [archaeon]